MEFEGKSVIVTGAGKGIGRVVSRVMARRGASIIGMSLTQEEMAGLTDETGARCIAADFSDTDKVRAAMKEAGTADYLVNCAGINVLESVLDMTDRGVDAVLNINLRAPIVVAQEFARARVAAGGGGAIVNISSIAGHRGFAEHVAYAASKAGLEGATRVMAKELGQHGIRVVALAPTITMTELAADAWSDPVKSEPMMVRHPVQRFAEPEDVARAVAMLLSDDAGMVTGSVLAVDGGFLAV
ncbi:SDR family oxidoreductase [Aliiruegeria lutimaris]|uniref:NAD(P)-dependent dehydrogenase, short-chain alcohol dehydrogenase family n=1 Tax=Aliiruegeria lutimaris TaxID=571298 RepID=A0A1G8RG76_9RHOB|nr:SDR family oxidoreductase [Aliiruegeria lutimaris]SDJ15996.1 NAD(P)-dependent dehydrogenase, short-chain alcohol dehydrogenase family [Aliiruegeria lutimaris]